MKILNGKTNFFLAVIVCTAFAGRSAAQSEDKKKEIADESKEARDVFLKKDPSMSKFFRESAGYVIFPNVGKGGLGVGGAAGNGAVFEGDKIIGSAKMTQVTIGLQAGGQAYREVIFFEKSEDLERFKKNKIEFSAQVSAVAASSGASANAKYKEGIAVFTIEKGGLMYEATLGGQKFKFTASETK